MLTRTGIRALCNTTAYRRGLDIYHGEDRVVEFRVQETEEEDLIQAYVKGRGSMQYSVRVKYNKRLDNLEKIFCECPEFQTQAGICKHCVAVLLKYVEHENRKQAALEREKKKAEEEKKVDTEDALQRFLPPDRLSQGGRQTTASMKLLMDRQHRRRLSPCWTRRFLERCSLCLIFGVQEQFWRWNLSSV